MITKDEIQELLHSTETYRVERTTSTDERSKGRGQTRLYYALQEGRRREPTGDMDKFQEAICAFANDNGGNVGGKDGGNVVENVVENIVENITDVPSLSQALSQALSQVDKRWQAWAQKKQPPVQRLQPRMKRLQVRHSQSSTAAIQTAAME
jgi:ATP-dependent DNA helicase RecG